MLRDTGLAVLVPSVTALVVLAVCRRAPLAAAAGGGSVLGLVGCWHQFGVIPRLQRAMVALGLVSRRDDGTRPVPHPLLRRVRTGRNLRVRWRLPSGVTLRRAARSPGGHRAVLRLRALLLDGPWAAAHGRAAPSHPQAGLLRRLLRGPGLRGGLPIGLGRGRRGDLWVDLARLPHLLVGGISGGGKSVFLRQATTFLATEYRPDRLQLVCLDLKGGVELGHFAELPHAYVPMADTIGAAARVLGEVRAELDRRLGALRRAPAGDIDAWIDAGLPRWPRIVVVVDELAELTARDVGSDKSAREDQEAARARLIEVSRLGRAAGIHLIVCTQRPDAEAVPGQLKANLAGTVAFRVRAGVNTLILLDCDRAALLPRHPGRAIWAEERIEEFQSVYLSAEESRRRLIERWGDVALAGRTGHVTLCGQSPLLSSQEARVETPAQQGSPER